MSLPISDKKTPRMPLSVTVLCEEYFQWRLTEYPEFATLCGYHQYDNKLNDHSVEAFEKRKISVEEFLTKLKVAEEDDEVSEFDKTNLMLLKEELLQFRRGMQHKGYLFPLSCIDGIHLDFIHVIEMMPFKSDKDFQNYLERLEVLPVRISSDIELMKQGILIGITHFKGSMEAVPRQIEAILEADPKESCLLKPLWTATEVVLGSAMETYQDAGYKILVNKVLPSLEKLKKFVTEEYLPNCRTEEGISSIPEGSEFYQECLRYHLSVEMSPQEVHDIGLREIISIRKKMEQVMRRIGFAGSIAEFVENLRNDPRFYFTCKEDCLESFRDICLEKIRPCLGNIFHDIPASELCIEEEKSNCASLAFYRAGSEDGSRPGKFMISVQDLKTCPKYNMTSLSLHEAEPGHHFQYLHAIKSKNLPRFRRFIEDMYYSQIPSKFPIYTAYCEGWGLYSEFLGYELGLYDDPYSEFGHLSYDMWRACRLVVDTGIHVFGWSSTQAVKLLLENTALAEQDVQKEVKRYIIWPGQACAYKIGELKILELRQKAEKALGDKFDICSFHEEILKHGLLTLNVLDLCFNQYIKKCCQKAMNN